jgi:NAD(P)-dependent dehydrogenase (short-subunit alcohol dehydrogenase family)
MGAWSKADVPSQAGRLAVVTGTGGLGYETALVLAQAGAEVILAGRNADKGRQSVDAILATRPSGKVRFAMLDLASLSSVRAFADRMNGEGKAIDLLINNAGVMTPPTRKTTSDGFELQLGTNYLGHFALTAGLLPLVRRGRQPRIVQLSSLVHRSGKIDFDDLQSERKYRPMAAYGQSKLAMILFALELQRRSDAGNWGIMSNAAHPGYARTELIANGPGADAWLSRFGRVVLEPWASHSAAAGALPTLFAATSPEARGGAYYGPNGFYELKGPPAPAKMSRAALDPATAARLWSVSETLVQQRLAA